MSYSLEMCRVSYQSYLRRKQQTPRLHKNRKEEEYCEHNFGGDGAQKQNKSATQELHHTVLSRPLHQRLKKYDMSFKILVTVQLP